MCVVTYVNKVNTSSVYQKNTQNQQKCPPEVLALFDPLQSSCLTLQRCIFKKKNRFFSISAEIVGSSVLVEKI